MRVTSACDDAVAAERFAAWLLRVGDGREPTAKDIDLIPVPPAMAVNSIAELVNCVIPDLSNNQAHLFANRAILLPKNDDCDEVNAEI